jgi:uncharacterized protein
VKYLLDVNALIALALSHHQHHQRIHEWLTKNQSDGWATCAFTQAAFVRIASQNHTTLGGVARSTLTPQLAADLLAHNLANRHHQFASLDFGYDRVLSICTGGVVGHRQVTDAWLVALAAHKHMKLVTFDSGINALLATTAERQAHLLILS